MPRAGARATIWLAMALLAGSRAGAGTPLRWTSIGPFGAEPVPALALAPSAPGTLYASTAAAIFRTMDRGEHWTRASTGPPEVDALAVDPVSAATAYACTQSLSSPSRIFRTDDSGATWQAVQPDDPNFRCWSVAVARGAPPVVYAGGSGVVWRSADRGSTWTSSGAGLGPLLIVGLAIAPDSTTTLYAAATDGSSSGGVFRSTDGGSTWTALTDGIGTPRVQAVAVSRSDSRIVWAATSAGFYRSRDAGASWTRQLPVVTGSGVAVAIDPYDPFTVFVSTGPFAPGFLVTHDGGSSWRPAGIPDSVAAVVFDPVFSSVLYAAAGIGVYRTDDGGRSWKLAVDGMAAARVDVIGVPPWAPGTVWVVAGAAAYTSSDRGTTWTPAPTITRDPRFSERIVRFVFDPASTGTAYAATVAASAASVYKTTDGGATWSAVGPTPSSSRLGNSVDLAIDPADPRTLYFTASGCFIGECGGGSFKTTTGGASWTPMDVPLMAHLAVDPAAPSTLYGARGLEGPGVFKSIDGGLSWTPLPGYSGGIAFQIAVAPGSPSTVYVVSNTGLFRSLDGGQTWSPSSYGIPPGFGVSTVLVDPRSARVLYAGTGLGVYRSVDGGDVWLPFGDGPPDALVRSLALDPATLTLYAGTYSTAAFRLSLGDAERGACSPSTTALCLNDGRFRAEVAWKTPAGSQGAGRIFPMTTDAGAFWFFSPNNLELAIKVVDGSAFNGRFWVFGGQLTDVEYTLTITDTATGGVWTHHNSQGSLASFVDTSAF